MTEKDVDIGEVLTARQNVHGDWSDNARITLAFWELLATTPNWTKFNALHKIGLYQILHKVSRICSGDPNFPDHWDDIAGYAIQTRRRVEQKP